MMMMTMMKGPDEPRQSEEVQRAHKTLPETPENQFNCLLSFHLI